MGKRPRLPTPTPLDTESSDSPSPTPHQNVENDLVDNYTLEPIPYMNQLPHIKGEESLEFKQTKGMFKCLFHYLCKKKYDFRTKAGAAGFICSKPVPLEPKELAMPVLQKCGGGGVGCGGTAAGEEGRVRESGSGDRVDPLMGIIFGLRRKNPAGKLFRRRRYSGRRWGEWWPDNLGKKRRRITSGMAIECIINSLKSEWIEERFTAENVQQFIKDEGTFSTTHTLLTYLQIATTDQLPIVAGLLFQLDLLVRLYSFYMYYLSKATGNSPATQIAAADIILALQGRFSSSEKPFDDIVKASRVGNGPCDKMKEFDNSVRHRRFDNLQIGDNDDTSWTKTMTITFYHGLSLRLGEAVGLLMKSFLYRPYTSLAANKSWRLRLFPLFYLHNGVEVAIIVGGRNMFYEDPWEEATNSDRSTSYQIGKKGLLKQLMDTTFENEMKWYTNERIQNQEDYSAVDALLEFTKLNEVQVRGHNVFWDDPNKLGEAASLSFYTTARELDSNAALFLNDFDTIESPGDAASSPDNYL
ncbi:carbohydrate-binding, CenC-like protein [Tanacetum coccineum]